ncbi:MAG: ATPase domain-containing protein [Solirubrobacteraceae bacterium]
MCGGPGCGKTLLAMQFLVRGAIDAGEPGVFMAFEESPGELAQNVASLGWDPGDLGSRGLLAIDRIRIAEDEIVRRARGIWTACASAWGRRSTRWARGGWCWIRWRRCSGRWGMSSCCARSCAGCFGG